MVPQQPRQGQQLLRALHHRAAAAHARAERARQPGVDGTGADPRIWRTIDATEAADYTVELLPAPGFAACVPNNQYSVVDPNGNMRLRVTGRSRGETRSVIATLRRRNFIDFIYFTDFETLDPAAYSEPGPDGDQLRPLPRPARRPRLHRDPLRRQRRRVRPVPHERQRARLRHADLRAHEARCDRDQRPGPVRDVLRVQQQPRPEGLPRSPRGAARDAALEQGHQGRNARRPTSSRARRRSRSRVKRCR